MNAHTSRKWSPIKIFMYLLLAICSLLVFWCQGASAMHLTPLNFSSFNLEHRRRHQNPEPSATPSQNHFISILRNSSVDDKPALHYQPQQREASPLTRQHPSEDIRKWQKRMIEKRARIQAHRKRRFLIQHLLNDPPVAVGAALERHQSPAENLKISANPNLNINELKNIINHNIITQHNHLNSNKLSYKINNSTSHDDQQHRREELYETLNEIMANISVASNRNRRESRGHHQQQMPSSPTHNSFSNNVNGNRRSSRPRKRYCSARDPTTLAFEAPTVFEGTIKSFTSQGRPNFGATVKVEKVLKKQENFNVPHAVRLQFIIQNSSECDIFREDFRQRGFVREELEQGKHYFLFVRQISLGNFTILGQPIKKNSRTAKDVLEGVSEKYGEYHFRSFDFIEGGWEGRLRKKILARKMHSIQLTNEVHQGRNSYKAFEIQTT